MLSHSFPYLGVVNVGRAEQTFEQCMVFKMNRQTKDSTQGVLWLL